MLPNSARKILIAFSDPGAAKSLLAFADAQDREKDILIVSDRVYDFYTLFNSQVSIISREMIFSIIKQFSPHAIFTGTSLSSYFEYDFWTYAHALKVLSYSYIDHYTSYMQRFTRDGIAIFPDIICVPDQKAQLIAQRDLNCTTNCIVTGNFFIPWLSEWQPKLSSSQVYRTLGISHAKKLWVFAPDPLSNVGGVEKYGMDEYSLLQSLIQILHRNDCSNIHLLIQCHPNQDRGRMFNEISKYPYLNISINSSIEALNLIFHSKLVIGMFSNILLEANFLKVPIVRCLFHFKAVDPFADKKIGTTLYSETELNNYLTSILNR